METTMRASRELLGDALPSHERLAATVRRALGSPAAKVLDWWVEPVPYESGTPSTGALLRVRGLANVPGEDDPVPWTIFVKVLQSAARWEHLGMIPAGVRQAFIDDFPWRLELAARASDIEHRLPDGLRLPALFDVHEAADGLAAVWMEDVQLSEEPWDLDRFARAARAIGQLAARRRADLADPFLPDHPSSRIPGLALRSYVEGRVRGAVASLGQEKMWDHPVVATALVASGAVDLRSDLIAYATRLDALLDHLDTLPQTYAHGDASPQNLLVPADDPTAFVVIDWGFNTPHAIGFDLGQLLIGLVHAGELTVSDLPAIHATIVPAYVEGARAEGMRVSDTEMRDGYVGSMAVRSAFTALPFESLAGTTNGDPTIAELWLERVRLTRYLLDLAATVPSAR